MLSIDIILHPVAGRQGSQHELLWRLHFTFKAPDLFGCRWLMCMCAKQTIALVLCNISVQGLVESFSAMYEWLQHIMHKKGYMYGNLQVEKSSELYWIWGQVRKSTKLSTMCLYNQYIKKLNFK